MNLDRVTTGNNVPNEFNVIIEIPSHSDPVKYEVDKETGMYTKISSFRDMPNTLLDTLAHFFAHYKDLEPGKWVKIKSWVDVEDAKTEILESIERYQNAPDKPYF